MPAARFRGIKSLKMNNCLLLMEPKQLLQGKIRVKNSSTQKRHKLNTDSWKIFNAIIFPFPKNLKLYLYVFSKSHFPENLQ